MSLKTIFKAYDVRGRVDNGELTPEMMQKIGASFASFTEQQEIIVGQDCRLSSPQLAHAFMQGVMSQNKNVLNLQQTTTDALYYSTVRKKTAGAIITASHNPAYYNGVKLCKKNATPLDSGELESIRDNADTQSPVIKKQGSVKNINILPDYTNHLLSVVIDKTKLSQLSIAIDGGNGMAGSIAHHLLVDLPVEVFGLYMEPDGNFPNHPADPSRSENLRDLSTLIKQKSPDLGVALDGDADRAVFIDDQGQPLSGSTAMSLISRWYLLQHQTVQTIVYDLSASRIVPQTIEQYGGTAVRSKVGFPFIKQAMNDNGAIFGCETSGHFYFKDNCSISSGLLSVLVMLQIISEARQPLSLLRQEFEPYVNSGEIIFEVAEREAVIRQVAAEFKNKANLDYFDGLTASWKDKWFTLRSSNTEPILRLNVEGLDEIIIGELVERITQIIKQKQSSK